MKKTTLLGVLFGMLISFNSMAQLGDYGAMIDTLLIKDPVSGFMWWKQPNPFIPGQCFQQYQEISGDTLNNAVLDKSWTDGTLGMHHYRYQQTYKGVPVEAAYAIEHFSASGKLIITNAKFAIDLDMNATPQYSESAALQEVVNHLPDQWVFAWEDTTWENEMETEMGPGTTWEPSGELMIAVDSYKDLGFYIPAERYRLAYKFDVMVVSPRSYTSYFVDAQTGEVFKEQSLDYHDGEANLIHALGDGVEIIDTRERGWPNNDWVLENDNDEKKIHTKYYSDFAWTWRAEIDKDEEPWWEVHQHATSPHWYAEQTWNYYKNVWDLSGMDDDNGRVRIHVDRATSFHDAYYQKTPYANEITFSNYSGRATGEYLDVVAHEFTHGVIKHSSDLGNEWEPGALGESFCDIFAIMAERYTWFGDVEPSGNWEFGHSEIFSRRLDNPKGSGEHFVFEGGCERYPGHPDTYQGEYWNESSCDYGNIHAKCGVQNYWFYLLSDGGAGVNDNGDSYDIAGIGETKASKITYHNMTDYMMPGSQYSDAHEGAIACAILMYGECSEEHVKTGYAWYAVGVGEPVDCDWVVSLEEEEHSGDLSIYPNPMQYSFTVDWQEREQFDIVVYSVHGQQLLTLTGITNNSEIILPEIAKGVYIFEVRNGEDILRKRIVKQ